MSEQSLSGVRDQWGRVVPIAGRSAQWFDGAGLYSPAVVDANGLLTVRVPNGAAQIHLMCTTKGFRIGGTDAVLTEDSAGGYIECAATEVVTLCCAAMESVKLRTLDGSASARVSFRFDYLG